LGFRAFSVAVRGSKIEGKEYSRVATADSDVKGVERAINPYVGIIHKGSGHGPAIAECSVDGPEDWVSAAESSPAKY
jgi:hypothetical protein